MSKPFICKICRGEFIPPRVRPGIHYLYCSKECAAIGKKLCDREYYLKHRDETKARVNNYYKNTRPTRLKQQRKYNAENREKRLDYYRNNKEKINRDHVKWCARKRQEDPIYRLHDNITSRMGRYLHRGKGGARTVDILGYSFEQLKRHLEKRFLPGMTWENYGRGGWHIDHIIPLRAFNITSANDIDFKRAWALSNLRPLWEHDNLTKNGKLEKPFQPSLALGVN